MKHNIAILCFPSYGGSGAVATELGKELATRGHKVHFIAPEVPFRLMGSVWRKNIFYHTLDNSFEYPLFQKYPIYPLLLANRIAEIIAQEKIDIIHAHYATPHTLAAYLAIETLPANKRPKIVTTLHGTDVSVVGHEMTISRMGKLALEKSDAITAVAKNLAADAKQTYSIRKSIEVIYNFMRPTNYPEKPAKELRDVFASDKQKLLIHISNFREVKRIQDVVEIFRIVNKKVDSKLLMVGDGPDLRIAHRLAAKHQLMNNIHFLGMQSNVSRLLAISDLFLLPSEKEAFSLSALEAMSQGVPVITTNIGGMPEMIQHGVNGVIGEVGDVATLAKEAIDLLSDTEKRQQISVNAKEVVVERFAPEKIVPEYEALYDRVTKKN